MKKKMKKKAILCVVSLYGCPVLNREWGYFKGEIEGEGEKERIKYGPTLGSIASGEKEKGEWATERERRMRFYNLVVLFCRR